MSEPCQDPVVEAVVAALRGRSAVGVVKYRVTLAEAGLTLPATLQHALEESMDLSNYLMCGLMELARLRAVGGDRIGRARASIATLEGDPCPMWRASRCDLAGSSEKPDDQTGCWCWARAQAALLAADTPAA